MTNSSEPAQQDRTNRAGGRRPAWRLSGAVIGAMALLTADQAPGHAGHGAHHLHLMDLVPGLDLVITLFALGLVMGRLDSDGSSAPLRTLMGCLTTGLVAGMVWGDHLPEAGRGIPLIVGGVLLINPGDRLHRGARLLVALAALAVGLRWGQVIPAMAGWPVFLGAAAAGGSLLAMAGLYVWQRTYRPWFPIALRIVGSWMAALGIILLGASFR